MFLTVFHIRSEPPTTMDIVFSTFFVITGLLLVLPYKFVSKLNMAAVLGTSTVVTFLLHCFILIEAGAGFKHSSILLILIYPIIGSNVFWHYRKSYNK